MIEASCLGVQAHCLRFEIQNGLEAVLAQMASRGLAAIELVRFPGCRGNPWGDFGAATDRDPADIGAAIRAAGLSCPSVMVSPFEAQAANLDASIGWVRGVGARRLILTTLPTPGTGTLQEWTDAFLHLNALGEHVRQRGLQLAVHTQPGLWASVDGVRLADRLLQVIDPACCMIEFDPSGPIVYGTDPAEYVNKRPEAFFSLHLRDGLQPPEPVFYLASEPLGNRYIDWPALLRAARASAIEWYFIEMEVTAPDDTVPAIDASLAFLRSRDLLGPAPDGRAAFQPEA